MKNGFKHPASSAVARAGMSFYTGFSADTVPFCNNENTTIAENET